MSIQRRAAVLIADDHPLVSHGLRELLRASYTVVGTVDPQSKRATFQFHVNPLVSWIWIGVLILIGGATLSLWPELSFKELGAWGYVRAGAGVATSIMLAIWLTASPTSAYAASERTKLTTSSEPLRREPPLGALGSVALGLGLGTVLAAAGRRRAR